MEHTFYIIVLTAENKIFEGRIVSLIAPGENGYLGVLANHASFVTTLKKGLLTLKDNHGKELAIQSNSTGILDVHHNETTVILDNAAMLPN